MSSTRNAGAVWMSSSASGGITKESRCLPCEGIGSVLSPQEVQRNLVLVPDWSLSDDGTRIRRTLRVKNFLKGLEYFREIAKVAEAEGHHPDLHLTSYSRVELELWTHALHGITDNDFIMAMKIDALNVPE